MTNNFDTKRRERLQRDRTFIVGGETFEYRPAVAPEAILRWSKMTGGDYVLRDEEGAPRLDSRGDPISVLSEEDAIGIFDETILAFLEPGQDEKWRKVRGADVQNPLNVGDMTEIVHWLFREQSGRPTGPSSASTPGSEETTEETPSTPTFSTPDPIPA